MIWSLGSFLLLCSIRLLFPSSHPYGDLTHSYTDHFSHMNAARLFFRVGANLWQKPIATLLPRVQGEAIAQLPSDLRPFAGPTGEVYAVPGWPPHKPIVASWTREHARPYPPGDLLVVAPLAALYHYTEISFWTINRLLIILFVFYTHIALLFVFQQYIDAKPHEKTPRIVILICSYVYSTFFAFQGFYDALTLVPLLCCAHCLQRKQGLAALVLYCVAATLHFRAFFLAPWAIYGAWLCWSQRARLRFTRWHGLAGVVAVGLAALSLGTFVQVWPTLRHLPINNGMQPGSPNFSIWWLAMVVGVWLWAATCFVRARAYLDLAVLGTLAVLGSSLHQAFEWHGIISLAWLCAPLSCPATTPPPWAARALWARIGSLGIFVTLVLMLPPDYVQRLFPAQAPVPSTQSAQPARLPAPAR